MINLDIGSIAEFAKSIIDRIWPPKADPNKKIEASLELEKSLRKYTENIIKMKSTIVLGEINGHSWLQRNWRPILMLSIVCIVVNNYLLYPYLSLFTSKVVVLELPDKLWSLMQIGVGGYIVSRGAEKGINIWKNGDK